MTNIIDSAITPYFLGSLSNVTNVTGDGTPYIPLWNTTIQGSGMNGATGIYTANISGFYLFGIKIELSNMNSSASNAAFNLVTTSKTYTFVVINAANWRSQAAFMEPSGYVFAHMNAGDTAFITAPVNGSTKVLGINSISTFFVVRLF